MAFTIANVSSPNALQLEGELLGMKARVVDLTFDSSYDNTNGEVLNASDLGWNLIFGIIWIRMPYDSTNKLAFTAEGIPNAAQTSLSIRAQEYNGAAAGLARLQDVGNATNLSTFTGRAIVVGA